MFIQILIGLGFVVAIYIVATLEARERERFKFKQYMTTTTAVFFAILCLVGIYIVARTR